MIDPLIRLVVADDHSLFRRTLVEFLREEAGLAVVGEAADGAEAVMLAARLRPDIVLMDYNMPGLNGAQATRIIRVATPSVRVIGLSANNAPDVRRRMLEAGAHALVCKGGDADLLVACIRRCAADAHPRAHAQPA